MSIERVPIEPRKPDRVISRLDLVKTSVGTQMRVSELRIWFEWQLISGWHPAMAQAADAEPLDG